MTATPETAADPRDRRQTEFEDNDQKPIGLHQIHLSRTTKVFTIMSMMNSAMQSKQVASATSAINA